MLYALHDFSEFFARYYGTWAIYDDESLLEVVGPVCLFPEIQGNHCRLSIEEQG